MKELTSFVTTEERLSVTTYIETGKTFPGLLRELGTKYTEAIDQFIKMINDTGSSEDLLRAIRQRSIKKERRMALLKLFRRCVSPVCDTELTKKVRDVDTEVLIRHFSNSFKQIQTLRKEFESLSLDQRAALVALTGEYDERGKLGYELTALFFSWFEEKFKGKLTITGPRGAGRDIELATVLPGFVGDCPCDFVVRAAASKEVLAVGFARYDATRGGAQSDDRTSGNSYKVLKAKEYCERSADRLRILFLADGPGLAHSDTWRAACDLDGDWDGAVRVTTMRLAPDRVTEKWLMSAASG